MKKIGIILGAAAVATLAGCKDPGYNYQRSTDVASTIEEVPVAEETPIPEVAPVETPAPIVVEEVKCACPVGTTHETACKCGANDCKCKITPPKPAEPAYTTYIVQRGDYLAKISKKYNITVASIKAINPQIKDDNLVKLGQKIKLPGKVDVGAQTVPAGAKAETKTTKEYKAYTGATKEYTIKAGDTLGKIAYGNGINIRQLKELNGMKSDVINVGQKIKIPADGKALVKTEEKKAAPAKAESPKAPEAEVPAPAIDEAAQQTIEQAEPETAPVVEEVPGFDYTVMDGEDLTAVSIKWGVSPAQIRELNNLGDGNDLTPGQIIKLPPEAQQ